MFSLKQLVRVDGRLRIRMRYADSTIIDRLAALYATRYRCPVLVTETAATGSVRRRLAWLESSVVAVRRTRERGVPLVGYTWWPLFALLTWGYREGRKPPAAYLRQMGLYDLRPGPQGLERVPTALVDRYREIVAAGTASAGRLGTNAELLDAARAGAGRTARVP
jgi:beta-glucosidase/6-phospho-beta-glucosidase/beta-galactosidase